MRAGPFGIATPGGANRGPPAAGWPCPVSFLGWGPATTVDGTTRAHHHEGPLPGWRSGTLANGGWHGSDSSSLDRIPEDVSRLKPSHPTRLLDSKGFAKRKDSMPLYMLQFAYSPESWSALVRKPEDRTAAVDAIAKSVGGRLVSLYFHMGEYDGTAIIEAPDDTSANAAIMATVASGALRSSRTTRLYSSKELLKALGKAGKISYRPPGKA